MSEDEARNFETHPLFKEILLMRTWDEKAKVVGMKVPGLKTYMEIIDQIITE